MSWLLLHGKCDLFSFNVTVDTAACHVYCHDCSACATRMLAAV